MVRVLSGEQISLPPFDLNLTLFVPQFYLILTSFLPLFNLNLTFASSGISNHGLETTVYRPLEPGLGTPKTYFRYSFVSGCAWCNLPWTRFEALEHCIVGVSSKNHLKLFFRNNLARSKDKLKKYDNLARLFVCFTRAGVQYCGHF